MDEHTELHGGTLAQSASLRPVSRGASKREDVRYFDIHEGEFDEIGRSKADRG